MANAAAMQKEEPGKKTAFDPSRARFAVTPAASVAETPEAFLIVADLPGVDDASLRVTLDRNVLTIDATPVDEAPAGFKLGYSEYEVEEGNYHRIFLLPDEVDREGISASMKDGVLRLTLPKAASAKIRRIPVTQG